MKHFISFLIILIASFFVSCVNNENLRSPKEFTVVTVNVDGMPESLAGVVPLNKDAPGEKYSEKISEYFAGKAFDLICLQENFNYDVNLFSKLEDNYLRDTHGGSINTNELSPDALTQALDGEDVIAVLAKYLTGEVTVDELKASIHSEYIKFPTDGLGFFWKKNVTCTRTHKVPWNESYGAFDHGSDALITKGFRRYQVNWGDYSIILYNLHTDASEDEDEMRYPAENSDLPDRTARKSQILQLRKSILDNFDNQPIIIIGDMNSYYARDDLKGELIDYIAEETGASVSDAWIMLKHEGEYPPLEDGPVYRSDMENSYGWFRNGEPVDKVIFINPKDGDKLVPLEVTVDTSSAYMREDGTTPLGDHFPLFVKFRLEPK